jgi:hypothetical protein
MDVKIVSHSKGRTWTDLGVHGKNYIITDLRELGWEGVDWIHLVQERDQCRDLANTVMNPRVL